MRSEHPPLLRLLWDSRGLGEAARLLWKWPQLRQEPRGSGEPVVVLPGFAASDSSTLVLRSYLRWLGYRSYGWGQGFNRGDVRKQLPPMIARTQAMCDRHGQRVQLIGWSLGGVIAREVARERADLVAGVITLGSPVVGGAKYTLFRDYYLRRGADLDAIEETIARRNQIPIDAPITAVCSRNDLVVDFHACRDNVNEQVEHVEVKATHLGLGLSPEVYQLIAKRLARP